MSGGFLPELRHGLQVSGAPKAGASEFARSDRGCGRAPQSVRPAATAYPGKLGLGALERSPKDGKQIRPDDPLDAVSAETAQILQNDIALKA